MAKHWPRHKIAVIVSVVIISLSLCTWLLLINIYPYLGSGLTIKPLPESYKANDIELQPSFEQFLAANKNKPLSLPLSFQSKSYLDLSIDTNVHLVNEYQYAKSGWGSNEELYWRKQSADNWTKLALPYSYMNIIGFLNKGSSMYIASIIGIDDPGLYLTDTKTGQTIRQFDADEAVASLNRQELIYTIGQGLLCDPDHVFILWNPNSGAKTHLTTITENDPCSGRSFSFNWSTDGKWFVIEGRAYKQGKFKYLYLQSSNELFNAY